MSVPNRKTLQCYHSAVSSLEPIAQEVVYLHRRDLNHSKGLFHTALLDTTFVVFVGIP